MKTILLPTDFSHCASNALDLGIQLSQKTGALIKLIHIVENPSSQSFNTMSMGGLTDMDKVFEQRAVDSAKKELESIVRSLKSVVEIEYQIIVCGLYDNISSIIANQSADLIVMGTRGSSGLKELIIGSNTEKVVRLASHPVISIHEKVDLKKFKNMICPMNPGNFNDRIASLAKNFQELFSLKIELLWVHAPHVIENEDIVTREFEEYIERNAISNCSINIRKNVRTEDGILSFADEIDADIILMATHGRQGLSHLFGGSYSEDIVNHSNRPVLTLRLGA
jgi:nucleotide-binding universal stress UspA family protein